MRVILLVFLLTGCAYFQNLMSSSKDESGDNGQKISGEEAKDSKGTHSVRMVDEVTFMFPSEKSKVWNAILDVIGKNYNIIVLDEKSGIISTDWDSFYLDGQTKRNKVSIRMTQPEEDVTKVLVANNEEVLKEKADNTGYVWLPGGEKKQEIKRIVKNTASILGHLVPEL
jgi:hypothetical protein